jgi:hypothetical protein
MNKLKEQFRLNGLPYTLLKRNEVVAMYGIGGTYTDEISNYEVDVIYIRKDRFGERERIAKNDDFGRDRSRCYIKKDLADKYFDKLTIELRNERKLSQGVAKPIAGVQENVSEVPKCHHAMTYDPFNNSGRLKAINSL